jgi:prevent-host-death family protein
LLPRTVAQAKAKLSELIEKTRTRGPQTITRNGRRTAVVVDAGSLADFFNASPLGGSGLKLRRSKDRLRSEDL